VRAWGDLVAAPRPRLGAVGVGLAVPFAVLTAGASAGGFADATDRDVVEAAHDAVRDHPVVVDGLEAVSFLGGMPWLLPFMTLAVVALAVRGRRREALFVAVTAASGAILNDVLKALVSRERPVFPDPLHVADGWSFPSGHAMAATICYGALVLVGATWLAPRAWRFAVAGAVLLVLAIGATRVLLGVHYPSDVVAGHVAGLAWLAGASALVPLAATPRLRRTPGTPPSVAG
jgi:membrane-associated phospholipid phosphatase